VIMTGGCGSSPSLASDKAMVAVMPEPVGLEAVMLATIVVPS
jgi:hypothetical protein